MILDFLGTLSFLSKNTMQIMKVNIIIPITIAEGEHKSSYRSVGDYE